MFVIRCPLIGDFRSRVRGALPSPPRQIRACGFPALALPEVRVSQQERLPPHFGHAESLLPFSVVASGTL